MATLANLSIGLSADSAKLKKDLDKAKGHSKKWADGQKKQFKGVAASIKLIGVAVAGISFGNFIRGAVQTSKELKVMSNLTGVSSEELQRVAPSLNRAGISLEKYADILKDVNDKSHDFLQTGGGPMADFFENIAPKIGITEEAFKGLSGKDALGLYVSSLEKAGLSTEQMTFYMEALASDSTMLLPLLRNNAAGMNEFALATNQVLSEETRNSLVNIGTSFATLGTIINNMTFNALQPLISFIEQMLDGWRQLITDFPAIVTGLQLVTAGVVALTLAMWANPVTLWVSAIAAVIAGVGFAYTKFKDLAEAVGGVGVLMTVLADSAKFEFNRIKLYGENLGLQLALVFNGIQDKWQQAIHKMAYAFAQWQDDLAASKMGEFMGLSGGNAERVSTANGKAMGVLSNQFEALSAALYSNNELLGETNPHWQKLSDALNGDDPIAVEFDPDSILDLTGAGGGGAGGGAGGTTPASTPDAKSFYETTAEQFVSGLKNSFSTALASGDWKGFLDSVLDSFTMGIINSFTEGLFAPMQDAIGGFMESLFSGMGSGGGGFFSGILSWFGAADGGIVPTTPFSKSYADSVPTMLQPGELVVPKSQVDNFMNGAGGGGGGQTFNINVTGDVSRLTRSEIVKMMPEIAAGTNMINRENGGR